MTIAKDLKQKIKSEATKNKILEAARNELVSKGYAGIRISNVAELAGVSKGALTHHFENKQSLITQVVEYAYQQGSEVSYEVIDNLKSGERVIDELVRDLKSYYLGENFKISISLLSLEEYEPELHQEIKSITRKYRLPIETKWIEKLEQFGLDKTEAKSLFALTQSMLRGMPIRIFLVHDQEYVDFILNKWKEIAMQTYPVLVTKKDKGA